MKLHIFLKIVMIIVSLTLPMARVADAGSRARILPQVASPTAGQMRYGAQVSFTGSPGYNGGELKSLGLRWAKLQMPWKDVEPNPGDYRWGPWDSLLQSYSTAGVSIMLSVVKAPDWARPSGDDRGVEGPPADYATLASFLTKVLQRYCGQVRAIEVWNEQNLWYEGGGRPIAPADYVQMLGAAYQAIKAVDPTITVVSGAPTPTGLNDGTHAIDDVIYLQGMYAAGLKHWSDAVGAHPSGYNNPPDARLGYTDPEEPTYKNHRSFFFRETMEAYRNVMVAAGDAGKTIWATEFGWATATTPVPGYDYAKDNTPQEQAQYIVGAYQLGASWGWVGGMFLWNLDFGLVAPGTELAYFSLLPPGPAYYAVKAMTKVGSPSTYIISGRATDGSGNGIPSVAVSDNAGHSAMTSGSGCYTLADLPAGTYTLTPSKADYFFTPSTRLVGVPPNRTRYDFVGQPVPGSGGNCAVPFLSQRDSRWVSHPLRTTGSCSASCSTIGTCGCTLTSTTMVFDFYGADLTPAQLSDCMDTKACPFYWDVGASCSGDTATWVNRYTFSWARLDQELNQNKRPVLLGMHKKTNADDTHWVVVVSGSGSAASGYLMHDPWLLGGANQKLSARAVDSDFDWIAVYSGSPTCAGVSAETPARVGESTLRVLDGADGEALVYSLTEDTMTVVLVAQSAAGNITEMMVWSDAQPGGSWQPFAPLVTLPRGENVFARFRDDLGNESGPVSDSSFPTSSPAEPVTAPPVYLPLVLR